METIATTMVLTGANSCAIIIPRAMETIVIEVKKEGRFGLSLAGRVDRTPPTNAVRCPISLALRLSFGLFDNSTVTPRLHPERR